MLDDRFWAKVSREHPEGCWVWIANKNNKGYGLFRARRLGFYEKVLAHRLSFMDAFGPIPKGGCILHKCDNPSCVNPAHLSLGTHAQNMSDMFSKGRAKPGRTGRNRLTQADVDEIRRLRSGGETCIALAKRFRVHPQTISDIARRVTWAG